MAGDDDHDACARACVCVCACVVLFHSDDGLLLHRYTLQTSGAA
jgi:hypothetical protein